MKRFVAGLLTAVLALAMLTACSSDNIKNPENAVKEYPTDPVEMEIYSRVQQACKELGKPELIYNKELSELAREDVRLDNQMVDEQEVYVKDLMEKIQSGEIDMKYMPELVEKNLKDLDEKYAPLRQENRNKINTMQTVQGMAAGYMNNGSEELPTVDSIKQFIQMSGSLKYFGIAYNAQSQSGGIKGTIWFMSGN